MKLLPNSELADYQIQSCIAKTYVLKCRIEWMNDVRYIYEAVAKSPVDALTVTPNEATMTWILGYKIDEKDIAYGLKKEREKSVIKKSIRLL